MTKKYFYLGLIIYYLVIFFAPHKLIYFAAFFVVTFFFYQASKNLQKSLVYSLILSLFSDVSLARSWFLMEPLELNLDSGYWISPLTLLILSLLFFSLRQKGSFIKLPDMIILLFFFWNVVVFIIYPYTNVLYGIILLAELCISYLIFRLYLNKDNILHIIYLLISMLLFQSLVGIPQFILQRPIGLTSEVVTVASPFGVTASENENLFRLTGTFWHPNFFASFLLGIMPFIFLMPISNWFMSSLKLISVLMLFFTYSRAAWIIAIIIVFFMVRNNKHLFIGIQQFSPKKVIFTFIVLLLLILFLSGAFFTRLDTFTNALTETGSFGTRNKLWQEGVNLFLQYPITGVGLNRSLEIYAQDPVTDIFTYTKPSSFYKIHNTFLEIASETGIPGITLFLLFLISVFWHYYKNKNHHYVQQAAFYGLIGVLLISQFNPFFHTSQFRLFFLLAAIILA